jgi:FlaA1/EpsC-like NDP-sugar epimerase
MHNGPVKNLLGGLLATWYSWLRLHRRMAFIVADAAIIVLSLYLAFWARFDGSIPPRYLALMVLILPFVLAIKLLVFNVSHIYRFRWSYIGFEEMLNTAIACGLGSLSLAAMLFIFQTWPDLYGFPRSILVIDFVFTFLGMAGIRLSKRGVRYLRSSQNVHLDGYRAVIVGAGDAGEMIVRSLMHEENVAYWPVGFLDDDLGKQNTVIHGVPVLGPINRLPELIKSQELEAVLIAMPSASSRVIRDTVDIARKGGAKDIKIVPFLSELYTGEYRISDIREVRPEDVLTREPVSVDLGSVEHFLKGKIVLVTGAAGSIGSELCRQVLRFSPAKLLALDFDETGLFNLENDLMRLFPKKKVQIIVGNIRDKAKMHSIFQRERPQVVFHAAAYKHVPMMEAYPEEAAKTNVFGTQILIEEAHQADSEAFVLISTDKAVNPVSVMGMTKRVAEIISLAVGNGASTRCIAVRFGNVLGSRGSVIPTFMEQIRRGGPVTVTHPEMERYFMTIPEAVLLVLQAGTMGKGGEVFVLDMGKPVMVLDIAKELIRFHNLVPDKDIPIVFTGIRPGEKLREELLTAEEGVDTTTHKQIYIAKMNNRLLEDVLRRRLVVLKEMIREEVEGRKIKETLAEIIRGSETQP